MAFITKSAEEQWYARSVKNQEDPYPTSRSSGTMGMRMKKKKVPSGKDGRGSCVLRRSFKIFLEAGSILK